MLFLLDANVLITANATYYPIDLVPEFWHWLAHQARTGRVKMPVQILDEVFAGKKDGDLLLSWASAHKSLLLLKEEVDADLVRRVLADGYAPNLSDDELETIGRDPFLIAYTLAQPDRCVVTVEGSQPKKLRQNRKVPDVCKTLGVACCNPFQAYRTLGFSTAWKPPAD